MNELEWKIKQVERVIEASIRSGAFVLAQVNDLPEGEGGAHFRITGERACWDWWPYSRLRTAYNPKTGKKEVHVDADRLIRLATPALVPSWAPKRKKKNKKKRKPGKTTRWKRRAYGTAHTMPCKYCGTHKTLEEMTVDHFVPRSRGGRDTIDNYVLACFGCNQDKDDDMPHT